MPKREQLKDDFLENRLIRRRLVLSAIITVVLLSLVLGRLYMLQIVEHEHFSTLSDSNRVRIKALPPTRGLIFDRHEEEVAVETFSGALRAAGLDFVRDPMGSPQIPNWSRVVSAMPDFLNDLAEAVDADAIEAG